MKVCRWQLLFGLCAVCAQADPAFDAFLEWLRGRGAAFGTKFSLGLDSVTGLRGVLAGEGIAKGTVIITLPKEVVLTSDQVQEEGVAWQQCAAGGPGEEAPEVLGPTHTAFALFLLEQRAKGAEWQPWVSVLPKSFEGFPLFYTEQELAGLQTSPVRRVIELDRNAVSIDFNVVSKKMPGLTLDEFRWARAAVKSRVFGLKSLSGGTLKEELIAMVPLADFVNHPPDGVVEPNVSPFYDVATGSFRLTAVRDIKPNEGIYWDYGFKSNRNSLLRYGFASKKRIGLTDMPLFFKLTDFPVTGAKALKMAQIDAAQESGVLAMEKDGTVMHELGLSLTGASAERLFGHMRFMVYEPQNASVLSELCESTYCHPIGLQNERQAMQHLVATLQALIASYGTTPAEDSDLVSQGELESSGGTAWHTLVVRFGEKQILRGIVKLLQTVDALGDLSPVALAKNVKERWSDPNSDIHKYVQENLTSMVEAEAARKGPRSALAGIRERAR